MVQNVPKIFIYFNKIVKNWFKKNRSKTIVKRTKTFLSKSCAKWTKINFHELVNFCTQKRKSVNSCKMEKSVV